MTQNDAIPADDLARHAQKMAKKKAARDRMMENKTGEKGLVIVHTGPARANPPAVSG